MNDDERTAARAERERETTGGGERRRRRLRRLGGGVLAVALGLGGVVLLMLFLNSRDDAGVELQVATTGASGPGVPFDGAGDLLDARQLRLLEAGDVFVLYSAPRPPAALRQLRETLSGPPDPVLEQAGQAVILQRRAGTDGVVALAWRRRFDAQDPADPELETFAAYWLGRGAAGG